MEKEEQMYIVAFNGSARKDGNTAYYIKKTFEPLQSAGHTCEMVQLAGQVIRGCTACMTCRKEETAGKCVYDDDIVNDCIDKMRKASVILIGSPTYFSTLTAETKALIDRAGYVARGSGNPFKRKIGAAIAVARRAGETLTFVTINQFFLINEMIVVGSHYWNVGIAQQIGEAKEDTEGIEIMHRLGENIAWLLEKI